MTADANGLETVQSSPCPRCNSLRTLTQLMDGRVLWRVCETCAWEWDRAEDVDDTPFLTQTERIERLEKGE